LKSDCTDPDPTSGVVVALVGDLDSHGCDSAWSVLQEAAVSADGTVVVDLSGVTFMDSSGLSMLLRFAEEVRADGVGTVTLRGADGAVRRLLKLTSMETIFELEL
jgi:anti-sigma B factor antagonist